MRKEGEEEQKRTKIGTINHIFCGSHIVNTTVLFLPAFENSREVFMARTKIFKFRLTPEEKLIITHLASLARRSESDFIRLLIQQAAEITPAGIAVYGNN